MCDTSETLDRKESDTGGITSFLKSEDIDESYKATAEENKDEDGMTTTEGEQSHASWTERPSWSKRVVPLERHPRSSLRNRCLIKRLLRKARQLTLSSTVKEETQKDSLCEERSRDPKTPLLPHLHNNE